MDSVDGQNHEILKPAISGLYIRFHPVYRPCFYFIRKQMTPFYWQQKLPDNPQALGYTLWFSLFSLKLNIFPFSASILTFSTQNHLNLKYFTNFDTARTARFSKKSLGSDVGEIKKMSEKLKKKVSVYTAKCPRKIEHSDLL
jgi:hypothetical protein